MIKKDILEKFIKQHHLGGINTRSKWKFSLTDQTLSTVAFTEDCLLRTNVVLKNINVGADIEIGISNNERLLKLLSILDEDIDIRFQEKNQRIISMILSDATTELNYVTTDLSIIPPVGRDKQLPESALEIPIDFELVDRFLTSYSIFKEDSEAFTIATSGTGKLELLFGHTSRTMNTTRIKHVLTPTKGTELKVPLSFTAAHLKEILSVNKKTATVFNIFDLGGLSLKYETPETIASYFLVKKTKED
jgi:hypothetical protein